MEIVRDAAHHDAFVDIDPLNGNLLVPDVHIETEESQVEPGSEDADIALDLFAAGQHNGRFREAVDFSGLDRYPSLPQLFFQSDRHRNPLLPGGVTGTEVFPKRVFADRLEPVISEDPPGDPRKLSKADEDQVVSHLQVVAQPFHRGADAEPVKALAKNDQWAGLVV